MRNVMLATLLLAAQAVLPYSAELCACAPETVVAPVAPCCGAEAAVPCDCGCSVRAAEPEDVNAATLVSAPLPAVDAVAPREGLQLAAPGPRRLAVHDRADLPGSADAPLSRAQRAPPA